MHVLLLRKTRMMLELSHDADARECLRLTRVAELSVELLV